MGEENPYKLLQLDKKPRFAISIYSSSPAGLQLHPIPPSLDCLNSLRTTVFFFSLFKAKVYYVLARPCRSIAVYLLFLLYFDRPLYTIFYWLLLYTPYITEPYYRGLYRRAPYSCVYLAYSLYQLCVGISPPYALDPYDRSRNVL